MLKSLLALIGIKKAEPVPAEPQRWPRPDAPDGSFVDMSEPELRHIYDTATCPYCHGSLYDGPSGGASRNMFCENVDTCDSRFNVGDPGMGVFIPMGQFTGGTPEGFKAQIRAMHAAEE